MLLHLTWSRVEANSRQSLCIKLRNPLNVSRKLCTKHFQRVEHRKVSIAGVCNRRGPMQAASPHAGLESGQPSCRRHKLARRAQCILLPTPRRAAHTVEHDFVINSILCGCQRCLVQLHWQCAVDDGGCSRCIFIDVRRGCRGCRGQSLNSSSTI